MGWVQGQDGKWYYPNESGQPFYMVDPNSRYASTPENTGLGPALFVNPNVPSGQTQLGVNWDTLPAEIGSYLNQQGVQGSPSSENGGGAPNIVPVTQEQLNQAAQSFGLPSVPSNWQTSQITVPGSAAPAPTNDIFANAPAGSPMAGQALATSPGGQGIPIVGDRGGSGGWGNALGVGGGFGSFLDSAGQFMNDPGVRFMLPAIAGGYIAGSGAAGAAEGAAGGRQVGAARRSQLHGEGPVRYPRSQGREWQSELLRACDSGARYRAGDRAPARRRRLLNRHHHLR